MANNPQAIKLEESSEETTPEIFEIRDEDVSINTSAPLTPTHSMETHTVVHKKFARKPKSTVIHINILSTCPAGHL